MTYDPNAPYSQPGQPDPGQQPFPGVPFAAPTYPTGLPPSIVTATPARPSSRLAGGTIALILAGVVAAAGLGFAGGRVTAPAATTPTRNGFGNFANGGATASGVPGGFTGGGLGAGAGGVTVKGTVSSIGNGQLVLTTASGTNVTIELPSTVTYHAQAAATSADVTAGATVEVTVNGFRGFGRNGGGAEASGAPNPAPSGATTATITATDVTIVSK